MESLAPYRGCFGQARPGRVAALPLPPASMPVRRGLRPLKSWRYVGVYGRELMLCAAEVRVGPGRLAFWAVWDRVAHRLHDQPNARRGAVTLDTGRLRIHDGSVEVELALAEEPGIEVVCAHGSQFAWTRKQGGIAASGTVRLDGTERRLEAGAVIDDSAGYHARRTAWRWSAGVGTTAEGRAVAWNLVTGINDPPRGSERTVWADGVPAEVGPTRFAPDLSAVAFEEGAELRFAAEAERAANMNRLLVRSRYRQPFGTFQGALPGTGDLAEAFGVMEEHQAVW